MSAVIGLSGVSACGTPTAGADSAPAVIPRPAVLERRPGRFVLDEDTVIVADAASESTARQLADCLRPAVGFALKIVRTPRRFTRHIRLIEERSLGTLGPEGYLLEVTTRRIVLRAPTQTGLFYAVQTLRQLLPPAIFSAQPVTGAEWAVPCVVIRDTPRFAWRGLMLDSGHDFQHLPFVYRFIDLMALHKFNVLHWHLTDLGTWSLEIKKYPKLVDPATRGRGVKPGYYTQEQIRQVVRYAAERHITIVPEIEMPGHSVAALKAYPELRCPNNTGYWQYCAGNEKVFEFLQDVLTEVMELFPSKFIHIGGDECPKDKWQQCPLCQARKRAEQLKNEQELQSYFIRRIEKFLNAHGRRLIGWDEILEGGLAPNASVMSWRGMGGGISAARAGHDVVMAPTSHLYFDYPQTPDRKTDPRAGGYTPSTLANVYSFEPIPPELTPEQAGHVLGAQAQMWTDTHPSEADMEWLVYPRACALAEVVWSPPDVRQYEDFLRRLLAHEQRLARLSVHYRPLATILAAGWFLRLGPFPKEVVDLAALVDELRSGAGAHQAWVLRNDMECPWVQVGPSGLPFISALVHVPRGGRETEVWVVQTDVVSEADQTVEFRSAPKVVLAVGEGNSITNGQLVRLRRGSNRLYVIGEAAREISVDLVLPGTEQTAPGLTTAWPTTASTNLAPYQPPSRWPVKTKTLAGTWRARLVRRLPPAPSLEAPYHDEGISAEARQLVGVDVADGGWQKVPVPAPWESYGGEWADADGEAVFRRRVVIPAEWAGRDLVLSLGAIDDFDDTYWNGVLVGRTDMSVPNAFAVPRRYKVPGHLVQPGPAVIAVRVFDYFGTGGLVGQPEELSLTPEQRP